ncbi:MAG TPA: hypothetical protein VF338_10680 [Leptolinea sp.]
MLAVELERRLNDFDPMVRQQAIRELAGQLDSRQIIPKPENEAFNLHCHTFFSFNAYGYSPSGLAFLAKMQGFKAIGIVDFDTLDGVNEFLDACETLGVRGSAGIETRVFIPEFSSREINSPGEPGICYHMGIGFTSNAIPESALGIANNLRQRSNQRNREMVSRINEYLHPVSIDYDLDVLPLTPTGNVTERHILTAYIQSVEKQISDVIPYWAKTLGLSSVQIQEAIADSGKFTNLIRSKLMKRGSVGYALPGPSMFPSIEEFHSLITACGAIPCFTWLNGISAGEKHIQELLDLLVSKGVAAVNVIPDRNWNISDPEQRRIIVKKLTGFIQLAQELELPIIVGTEMNSPGNKLVDDFNVPELLPFYQIFLDGAYFIFGHTFLQRNIGPEFGYPSEWARTHFPGRHERNAFYVQAGRLAPTGKIDSGLFLRNDSSYTPDEIITKLKNL